MHSLLLDKLPSSFESTWYRNRVNKPDGLRNSNQIYVLYARLVFTERLPLHSFPKTYNNLISPSLKGKLSMDSFKESLMDYFINEYKEIIYCGRPYCKDCFPNQMWTNYCQGPIWLYCMDVCGLRLFYSVQKFVSCDSSSIPRFVTHWLTDSQVQN